MDILVWGIGRPFQDNDTISYELAMDSLSLSEQRLGRKVAQVAHWFTFQAIRQPF